MMGKSIIYSSNFKLEDPRLLLHAFGLFAENLI